MQPGPLPALPRRGPEPGWSDLAFDVTAVVLGVAGFIGAAFLVWESIGLLLHFFEESATPEEVAESHRLLRLAAVVGAAAVPLVGLLLALWVRRRRVVGYFVALLVLGGLFTGLVGSDELSRWQLAPVDYGPGAARSTAAATTAAPVVDPVRLTGCRASPSSPRPTPTCCRPGRRARTISTSIRARRRTPRWPRRSPPPT